jgi:hypothetical protein
MPARDAARVVARGKVRPICPIRSQKMLFRLWLFSRASRDSLKDQTKAVQLSSEESEDSGGFRQNKKQRAVPGAPL